MSKSPNPSARIVKVYMEALPGFRPIFHPDGLEDTLLSQAWVLASASNCGNYWQYLHFKDMHRCEEPPIAWMELVGQPGVIYIQWPSPTSHPSRLLLSSYMKPSPVLCTEWPARVSLAWDCLFWWLSVCTGGRKHGDSIVTFERKYRSK